MFARNALVQNGQSLGQSKCMSLYATNKSVCIHVGMYAFVHVRLCVRIHADIQVRMYVNMYTGMLHAACMHAYISGSTCISQQHEYICNLKI